jgi:hypothetical protein
MAKSGKTRPNRNVQTRFADLTEEQQAVSAALTVTIAALRRLAHDFADPTVDSVQEAQEAFDAACAAAADPLESAGLLRFLSVEGDSAWCVRALLRESASLGHPPTGTSLDTGKKVTLFSEDFLLPLADRIDEIDHLDFEARLELYVNERDRGAAIALGVHLARFGDNDLFADVPWSGDEVRNCQAAAAIATAALSRLVASREPGEDEFRGLTGSSVAHSDAVAAVAYHAYATESRSILGGFGAASQVVEDLLYAADLEDLESTDLHRLSGQLASAFVAGVGGEDFGHNEDKDQALAVLAAAYEAGLAMRGVESEAEQGFDNDGSGHRHPSSLDSSFGHPPGSNLVN